METGWRRVTGFTQQRKVNFKHLQWAGQREAGSALLTPELPPPQQVCKLLLERRMESVFIQVLIPEPNKILITGAQRVFVSQKSEYINLLMCLLVGLLT